MKFAIIVFSMIFLIVISIILDLIYINNPKFKDSIDSKKLTTIFISSEAISEAKGLSPKGSYLKLKRFTPILVIFLGCLGVLFIWLGGLC